MGRFAAPGHAHNGLISGSRQVDMDIEDGHRACFELGIKFGSLYHQFAGTPVSPRTAPGLASAIEEAIENQPHCVGVDCAIEIPTPELTHGYTELAGRHLDVDIEVELSDVRATAGIAMVDGYPLMELHDLRGLE